MIMERVHRCGRCGARVFIFRERNSLEVAVIDVMPSPSGTLRIYPETGRYVDVGAAHRGYAVEHYYQRHAATCRAGAH